MATALDWKTGSSLASLSLKFRLLCTYSPGRIPPKSTHAHVLRFTLPFPLELIEQKINLPLERKDIFCSCIFDFIVAYSPPFVVCFLLRSSWHCGCVCVA